MRKIPGKERRSGSVMKKFLIPMSVLLLIQILLFAGTVYLGGVTTQLDQNAYDILNERVINRMNYLENEMISRWSNVGLAVDSVNATVQDLVDTGEIDINDIETDADSYLPVLSAISEDIISLMRTNSVTGAFVVFNRSDLSVSLAPEELENKSGIYFRDLDPISKASSQNTDLLIERAPTAIVHQLNIPTDSGWRPSFDFKKNRDSYYPFLYKPYQQALKNRDFDYHDLGYWSRPYKLYDDDRSAISYSVPLILKDGTVYGVLGVELTLEYLQKVVPYDEIVDGKKGSYVLAIEKNGDDVFEHVMINGPIYTQIAAGKTQTVLEPWGEAPSQYRVVTDDSVSNDIYGSIQYLELYNSNTPFSDDRWALIGVIRGKDLFAFSNHISFAITIAIIISLVIGLVGVCLVSFFLSKPIMSLAKNVQSSNTSGPVKLARTRITEVDRLAVAIENLSSDVFDSATKFTHILEMASIKIGGFEINTKKHTLFVTEHFFDIFHLSVPEGTIQTVEEFKTNMDKLSRFIQSQEDLEDSRQELVYKIPAGDMCAWIRLKYLIEGDCYSGLAEDITKTTMELQKIEFERDYDLLTNLINRRAFHRMMNELFDENPSQLKVAALVMLDLDNLKFVNDTYGHDYGDKYIREAANSLVVFTPESTLVSRISGDEFLVFFYGYNTRQEVRNLIEKMKKGMNATNMEFPDSQTMPIKASAGVAWYPSDSLDYEQLIKYADFAMYEVKRTDKGQLNDFDIANYNKESYLLQSKEEFHMLLEEQGVIYYFQPIVNAHTGEIFAYEALMRSSLKTLKSPQDILSLAKMEYKLDRIEYITWFKAMQAFVSHCSNGIVDSKCRIFINSIPNQVLSAEAIQEFERLYKNYLDRIVQEITEEEKINEEITQQKAQFIARWNAAIALDDYGSGYNGDRILLNLNPQYVKIDMDIVRDIDTDSNKQKIVENLISYAHERNMLLIAEGVETYGEMETVIRMGVDYLQGYYLARPAAEPPMLENAVYQSLQKANLPQKAAK